MQQVQNLVPGLLLVAGLLCLQYPTQCKAQPTGPTGSRCPPVKGRTESCVCQVREGFMVDLSSLGNTDGTPRFTNLNDDNGWLYSYNPCKPFTTSCGSDLHICQTKEDNPDENHPVASGGTEEMWLDTDKTPYLYYTGPGPDPDSKREAVAYFHCDKNAKNPRAETVGDSRSFLRYIIDVYSDKACETIESSSPNGPGGSSGGVAPGEVGIVLIVLLIVGVAAYFIVGTLVMVFHYKESGTNVIPNKNLWIQFPLLVKDGFVFTFGPCITFIQGKVRGSQGYSKT